MFMLCEDSIYTEQCFSLDNLKDNDESLAQYHLLCAHCCYISHKDNKKGDNII